MSRKSEEQPFRYTGFPSPNGTVVPDDVFDVLMPELSEAELRVLLYIIRRTFGFKKNSDAISLSQMVDGVTTRDGRTLDRGTGMSRRGVMRGCAGLVEKGVIRVEKRLSEQGDNEINVYHLRFQGEPNPLSTASGGVGNDVPHPRERGAPRVGNHVPPQQTESQQTESQHSNIRNSVHKSLGESERPLTVGSQRQGEGTEMVPLKAAIGRWRQRAAAPSSVAEQPAPGRRPVAPQVGRPRRTPHQDEAYQVIQAYIADFARELNDRAPLKTSTTRAYHLYRRSGLDQAAFIAQLYAARAIVKERTGSIRNVGEKDAWGVPVKQRAAYYFAVLEDLLGLRAEGEDALESPRGGRKSPLSEA